MTLEEKRQAIEEHCCQTPTCEACPLDKFMREGERCFGEGAKIERNYALITKDEHVDHPAHYQGKYECIDEMVAMFGTEAVIDFCRCNVYKYRYRAKAKGGEEDIEKAEWYMGKLMDLQNQFEEETREAGFAFNE